MSSVVINVGKVYQTNDLWSAVMGSGWEMWSWWKSINYLEGDWDEPGVLRVEVEDPEDEDKTISKDINAQKIIEAMSLVAGMPDRFCDACTGRPIDWDDLDFDACVGDLFMQYAVFGETVYA